jgi:5-methylthioadenosine/S-adenosylhomocysteine deaminase
MARLRIEGGNVLPLEPADAVIEDGVVVVEGFEVTYVGPQPGPVKEPGEQVLDASGCVVMPGLVNAHTHVSMTLLRGYADDMALQQWLEQKIWPAEMKLRYEDVYWGAMLGIGEMLRGGITTFNDMYHYPDAVAQAVLASGIRGCISGVMIGILPTAEELLREAIELTAEIKRTGHPRLVPMLAPHALYTCPDELLQRMAAAALDLGVRIHIHLSETAKEVEDSVKEHGVTPVQHLERLGVLEVPVVAPHCVHLTDEDIEILARRKVGVVHCPTSNMKLASGFAPIGKLLRAEAIVGLGTDGAASNNNLDMFEEMMVGAVIAKGHTGDPTMVSAPQMLAMATKGSAAALGLQDQIGALTPGRRADIIVVELDRLHMQPVHNIISHLVYSARADDVRDVIIEGEVVMRERKLLTMDEAEVKARAGESATRLIGNR